MENAGNEKAGIIAAARAFFYSTGMAKRAWVRFPAGGSYSMVIRAFMGCALS
jgi:hypothetical protein